MKRHPSGDQRPRLSGHGRRQPGTAAVKLADCVGGDARDDREPHPGVGCPRRRVVSGRVGGRAAHTPNPGTDLNRVVSSDAGQHHGAQRDYGRELVLQARGWPAGEARISITLTPYATKPRFSARRGAEHGRARGDWADSPTGASTGTRATMEATAVMAPHNTGTLVKKRPGGVRVGALASSRWPVPVRLTAFRCRLVHVPGLLIYTLWATTNSTATVLSLVLVSWDCLRSSSKACSAVMRCTAIRMPLACSIGARLVIACRSCSTRS